MELQRKHDLKSEEIFLKKIIFEVSIERSKDFSEVPSREKYCRTKEKHE